MKYLSIKIKDVKRYIGYYEEWYNNFDKDGYKYVKNIEQLEFDDKYYDDILSSLHNFVKGGEFYPIKIKN
jgi:intein/homing endonuclease